MKITIGLLLALTAFVACMLQYRRVSDRCASLEYELSRYEHMERDHTYAFRQGLELTVRIHRCAAQAPSPTVLHGVVTARHELLTASPMNSKDDNP